jgi:hypothetical protein
MNNPKCPYCNRTIGLRLDGTFYTHLPFVKKSKQIGEPCEGTGKLTGQEYFDQLAKENAENEFRKKRYEEQQQWVSEKRKEFSKVYRSKEWKEQRKKLLANS